MNKTKYLQTDSRWGGLGYPKAPWYIRNCGCGEVSICNVIIEMSQYAKYTPATIQPYCKQYADPHGNGTYHSGIPAMMKHYGLTEVKEHATMDALFKELAKGDRVAIYLMGSRPGGSKKVHWTSGGHFVASVDYKYKDGDHWVYMKDSNSNSSLRNGWISYKGNIRGDCLKVWSGKLNGSKPSPTPTPTPTPTGKLVVDGKGGPATVKRMQQFFKTTQDGVISGQMKQYAPYYPSLNAVQYGKGGSSVVTALQKWLNLEGPYGIIGPNTTKAWQRRLRGLGYLASNETIDGIFGVKSMSAWQEALNNDCKKKVSPEPTPDPKPTPSKTDLKVIDVSQFQDAINWTKAKADGVKGVIVRCGYRGAETGKLNEDPMFLNHIQGAYKAGIPVGLYMFTEAINEKEGREEADFAIKMWKKAGVSLSFPIGVDTETVKVKKERARDLTKAQRTTAIKGFCERIKELGYTPMIYASTSWLNNKLDMSKLPYNVWVAQYNSICTYKGKYIMWQYSSTGKVSGAKGDIDMNHCYIEPKEYKINDDSMPTPTPTPEKQGYQGTFPTYRLTKTNAKVKSDACEWAKKIAANNDFHYGYGKDAHHNGCFYCGTQPKSKQKSGIKMWQTTYCCNPFVGAAWAHGGGDAQAYKNCHNGTSWDFSKGKGYDASKLFDKLGHPDKSTLKTGDVLCNGHHVALYLGGGKIVEAGHSDDNKIGSKSWNSSIEVSSLTDKRWKGFERAYRYNSKVDCDRPILYGEYSDRVADMQRFLIWYGYKISVTGFYNKATLEAVIKFQEAEIGKGQGDGSVGPKTIEAMKRVKK